MPSNTGVYRIPSGKCDPAEKKPEEKRFLSLENGVRFKEEMQLSSSFSLIENRS